MRRILVVADETWVRNDVHAAVTDPDIELVDHTDPSTVVERIIDEPFAIVLVDLQVAAMGGMAVTRAVREAASLGSAPTVPVVMLLDRSADAFLAKRAGAAAWLLKPISSHEATAALRAATSIAAEGIPSQE